MKLIIFDLSWLFWSIAMGNAGKDVAAPFELTLGRVVQLAAKFDRVAIACDGPGRSFRTNVSNTYKADRDERPRALWAQLESVSAELEKQGHHVFVPPAYPDGTYPEADDVIATLVAWYKSERSAESLCRIVSGDSDLAVLVDDEARVQLHRTAKDGSWITYTAEMLAGGAWDRVPVHPSKLAEFKALAGDSTDGYKTFPGKEPGKPGIGAKGAAKLLAAYGTAVKAVEAALAEPPPEDMDPSTVATLRRGKLEGALKGLELASLRSDVAIDCASLLRSRDVTSQPPDDPPRANAAPAVVPAPNAKFEHARAEHRAAQPVQAPAPVAAAAPPAPPSGPRAVEPPPARPAPALAPVAAPEPDAIGRIRTTAQIDQIANALAAAQGEIEAAVKDSENPHFGRMYADLASVWRACRGPLSKHGLAVIQVPTGGWLITRLVHRSGQWIEGDFKMTADTDRGRSAVQALGSTITYLRRYALSAMVGVAPDDDDDGESAEGRGPPPGRHQQQRAAGGR